MLSPLQRYQAQRTGIMPKQGMIGPGDAEFIDDSVYASGPDPAMEGEPRGLVDRLAREQNSAKPLVGMPKAGSGLGGSIRPKGIAGGSIQPNGALPTRLPTVKRMY